MQHDLQQQISQFFLHFLVVAGIDRIDQFVTLLDQMWFQALVRLFAIPGTALRRSELSHNISQSINRRSHKRSVSVSGSGSFSVSKRQTCRPG